MHEWIFHLIRFVTIILLHDNVDYFLYFVFPSNQYYRFFKLTYIFKINCWFVCRSSKKSRSTGDGSSDPEVMVRSASEAYPLGIGERLTIVKSSQNNSPNRSPAMIAQTNWNFVDKLLKVRLESFFKKTAFSYSYFVFSQGFQKYCWLLKSWSFIVGFGQRKKERKNLENSSLE